MTSIYKSDDGRARMERWYVHFLDKVRMHCDEIEERRVPTRHGETHVIVAGPRDAPPLLCFHGVMACAPLALAHIPDLMRHFRVYFPDTVGQPGRSDHTRLDWQGDEHGYWALDVIDQLSLETVTTLGISLGGYVILRLASIAPERVDRAVLWAPGGLVHPPLRPMLGLIWDALVYNLRPSRSRLERVVSRTFTDLDDDFVEYFADALAHVHPDRRFPAILPDGVLSAWTAPKMLILNEHDAVFPADLLRARAERELTHVEQTLLMPGFAHMPPFRPGALDDLIQQIVAFTRDGDEKRDPRVTPSASSNTCVARPGAQRATPETP